ISDWVVTEADCTRGNSKVAEDPVGLAYWPPDMHHARRIVRNGQAWNEGFVFGGGIDWRPFGISYRAIRPKADECANLLVPCALSSSYVGYGAVRIEWTFMVLGQSAGTAAAFAAENSLDVQEVTYDDLRPLLLAGGQILGSESLRKTE
ncbi:MAG: FAD-dependent oxidoreductase, partial [Kiritimatiellae bacterium]|nr:FAD-dependent oxidoreductase [Kiritimatiellia bacterium]